MEPAIVIGIGAVLFLAGLLTGRPEVIGVAAGAAIRWFQRNVP